MFFFFYLVTDMRQKKTRVSVTNQISDIRIPLSDALLLSHRDSGELGHYWVY